MTMAERIKQQEIMRLVEISIDAGYDEEGLIFELFNRGWSVEDLRFNPQLYFWAKGFCTDHGLI